MTDAGTDDAAEQSAWDSYLWEPGGSVLRNLWGERDGEVLRAREYAEVAKRQLQLDRGEVEIPRTYDSAHLRAIHAHLFGNVYEWAGQYRTVEMSKGFAAEQVMFAPPDLIDAVVDMSRRTIESVDWPATDAEQFADGMAKAYGFLNLAHPFREGNGRAAKVMLQHVAEESPWRLEFGVLDVATEPGEPSPRDWWNLTSALSILQADGNGPAANLLRPVFRGLTEPRSTTVEQPAPDDGPAASLDADLRALQARRAAGNPTPAADAAKLSSPGTDQVDSVPAAQHETGTEAELE